MWKLGTGSVPTRRWRGRENAGRRQLFEEAFVGSLDAGLLASPRPPKNAPTPALADGPRGPRLALLAVPPMWNHPSPRRRAAACLAAARRRYSRASPPQATAIRLKNHVASVGHGEPKEGPKPRQLLSLPPFPSRPLPAFSFNEASPSPSPSSSSLRVTAISWVKYYFHGVHSSVVQSHFNKGLVCSLPHFRSYPFFHVRRVFSFFSFLCFPWIKFASFAIFRFRWDAPTWMTHAWDRKEKENPWERYFPQCNFSLAASYSAKLHFFFFDSFVALESSLWSQISGVLCVEHYFVHVNCACGIDSFYASFEVLSTTIIQLTCRSSQMKWWKQGPDCIYLYQLPNQGSPGDSTRYLVGLSILMLMR